MEDLSEEHKQYLVKEFRIKTSDARPVKYHQMEGFSPAIERKIHTSEATNMDRIYGSPGSAILPLKIHSTKSNNFNGPNYFTQYNNNVNKSQPVENILGVLQN